VIFLMVGAPMIAAVLHGIFGRKHGSLLTGLASGAGAYWFRWPSSCRPS
jgi:hypothetical protein